MTPTLTQGEAARSTSRPDIEFLHGFTVEHVKNVLATIDSRFQFDRQDLQLPGFPSSSILYSELEAQGVRVIVNLGVPDGEEPQVPYLKMILAAQGESSRSIPDSVITQYITYFVHACLDNGDVIWAQLLAQPDLLDNAFVGKYRQMLEGESCRLMLVRTGRVNASQFEEVEFEIMTRKYVERLESSIPKSLHMDTGASGHE